MLYFNLLPFFTQPLPPVILFPSFRHLRFLSHPSYNAIGQHSIIRKYTSHKRKVYVKPLGFISPQCMKEKYCTCFLTLPLGECADTLHFPSFCTRSSHRHASLNKQTNVHVVRLRVRCLHKMWYLQTVPGITLFMRIKTVYFFQNNPRE
jgi:hypothetical protein